MLNYDAAAGKRHEDDRFTFHFNFLNILFTTIQRISSLSCRLYYVQITILCINSTLCHLQNFEFHLVFVKFSSVVSSSSGSAHLNHELFSSIRLISQQLVLFSIFYCVIKSKLACRKVLFCALTKNVKSVTIGNRSERNTAAVRVSHKASVPLRSHTSIAYAGATNIFRFEYDESCDTRQVFISSHLPVSYYDSPVFTMNNRFASVRNLLVKSTH